MISPWLKARHFTDTRITIALGVTLFLLSSLVIYSSWTDIIQTGSDTDEYLLAAERVAALQAPIIADIEYTKYPLGYATVLALLHHGLSVPLLWLLYLNRIAVLITCLLAASFFSADSTSNRGLFLLSCLVAVLTPAFWTSAQMLTPDVLCTLFTTLGIAIAYRGTIKRTSVWTAASIGFAVALKTLAITAVLPATLLLYSRQCTRRQAWFVPALAGVIFAGSAITASRMPAHTTGYSDAFLLRDPYDQSLGRAGIGEIVTGRLTHRPKLALYSLGSALAGNRPRLGLVLLLFAGLGILYHAPPPLKSLVGVFMAAQSLLLTLWPYDDPRFWLPVVPFVATGTGLFFWSRRSTRWTWISLLLFGVLGYSNLQYLTAASALRQESAIDTYRQLDLMNTWMKQHAAPHEIVASFDYREIHRKTRLPVRPLPYTSDVSLLVNRLNTACWLVSTDLFFSQRHAYATTLANSLSLQPEWRTTNIFVYRLQRNDTPITHSSQACADQRHTAH